jgi:hypothetical protein
MQRIGRLATQVIGPRPGLMGGGATMRRARKEDERARHGLACTADLFLSEDRQSIHAGERLTDLRSDHRRPSAAGDDRLPDAPSQRRPVRNNPLGLHLRRPLGPLRQQYRLHTRSLRETRRMQRCIGSTRQPPAMSVRFDPSLHREGGVSRQQTVVHTVTS